MTDVLLTLNAGSSSIKFALFERNAGDVPEQPRLMGQIDGLGAHPHLAAKEASGQALADIDLPLAGAAPHREALSFLLGWLDRHAGGRRIGGVGHRVVHGGEQYARPIRLDAVSIDLLRDLIPLAPLHQPHNLAGIEAMATALPGVPQVACFDTAFHRSQPEVAQRFALPRRITEGGVRRYGFHGLSYEFIAAVLGKYDAQAAAGRTIVLHLGNGSSMCAIEAGRSIASTMGFTALDGLPMGTRCGAIDPGVLLYLMDQRGMDARAIEKLLYSQSGLLGVSGISSDMRKLLESDDARARLAVDVYTYRIRREMGSLAAALGGVDAIVFTAGIGENSAEIRARICRDAAWLGVRLDDAANASGGPRISAPDSRVAVWVIPTNEELMIARHTQRLATA